MNQENQGEFTFGANYAETGYDRWQEERRRAAEELAWRLGLPLGHAVEIWLKDGVRLRGLLRLKEEFLFAELISERNLELRVDKDPFRYDEMESCVRRD